MKLFSNTRLCGRVDRVHIDSDSCWGVAKVDIGTGWFAFALITLHDWLGKHLLLLFTNGSTMRTRSCCFGWKGWRTHFRQHSAFIIGAILWAGYIHCDHVRSVAKLGLYLDFGRHGWTMNGLLACFFFSVIPKDTPVHYHAFTGWTWAAHSFGHLPITSCYENIIVYVHNLAYHDHHHRNCQQYIDVLIASLLVILTSHRLHARLLLTPTYVIDERFTSLDASLGQAEAPSCDVL